MLLVVATAPIKLLVFILKSIGITAKATLNRILSSNEKSVLNEIVLITGTGHGIGKELALQYAALGATVVSLGISREKNLETIDEISRLGYPKAYFYLCDVSDHKSVMQTAKKVAEEVGDVTILINNAGVAYSKPFLEHTSLEIEHTLGVNIKAHCWTIQAFLPAMLKNNHGHIVANCSISGLTGLSDAVAYSASKFAVRGLMEALSRELRKNKANKVKTTTVCPFFVNTPLFEHATFRFGCLNPKLEVSDVARKMISAQRRNVLELAIPSFFSTLVPFMQFFPSELTAKAYDLININILPTTTVKLDSQINQKQLCNTVELQ